MSRGDDQVMEPLRNSNEPKVMGTGIPGLDELLCGGLMPRACVLVEGMPGAGKTTMGLQFIHEGATRFGERGVIYTFEEFPQELHRDARAYGWDLEALEQQDMLRVVCTSPEVLLDDAASSDGRFSQLMRELEPRRVLVDSITQLAAQAPRPADFRSMLYGLRNALKREAVVAMLTSEAYSPEGQAVPMEEYLVDVVIRLGYRMVPGTDERVREIEVAKSRARPNRPGRYPLQITGEGLKVLGDLALAETASAGPAVELSWASTGCAGLDAMLRGGLVRGTTTLLAGSTGLGKTILGLQFLCEGAEQGEQGLFVSYERSPGELAQMARAVGLPEKHFSPGGKIEVFYDRPTVGTFGYSLARLNATLGQLRPQRVVVDAISSVAGLAAALGGSRSNLTTLLRLAKAGGATTLVCDETPGIVGDFQVTGGLAISSMVDSIIIMRYVELASEIRRALSVLKAHYVDHDKEIREYVIGPGGLKLEEKFKVSTGLLRGAPVQRQVEEFF